MSPLLVDITWGNFDAPRFPHKVNFSLPTVDRPCRDGLKRPETIPLFLRRGFCTKDVQKCPTDLHTVIPMVTPIILASGSEIRGRLLQQANIPHAVEKPRVDEDAIKLAMQKDGATPRDIADALAEAKARRISAKHPEALVLGCDQVLDHRGEMMSKPTSRADAIAQLTRFRGDRHMLLSAAVLYESGRPIWRHIGPVRLRMREVSDTYIADYVERNWESIRHSVGCYKLEEEGVRLFSSIEGDYFHVLGMPLLELMNYLVLRGELDT